MAKMDNLTETLVKAQSIDLVERFGQNVDKLKHMLKLERLITMQVGSTIKTYTSKVTLDGTKIDKGQVIPLSKVEITEGPKVELEYDKKRKAVAVEDIQKFGRDEAISYTDEKLVRELQKGIKKAFFEQLKAGTTEVKGKGLQAAIAQAWGGVVDKFEDDEVRVIGFLHPSDVADYLGSANLTIQNAFGVKYIENFMNFDVVIISNMVEKGKLYATASDNLILAYAPVDGGEIGKEFDFTTDETGLIGITHYIDKQTLTTNTVLISVMKLFAERLDGIVKATIEAVKP